MIINQKTIYYRTLQKYPTAFFNVLSEQLPTYFLRELFIEENWKKNKGFSHHTYKQTETEIDEIETKIDGYHSIHFLCNLNIKLRKIWNSGKFTLLLWAASAGTSFSKALGNPYLWRRFSFGNLSVAHLITLSPALNIKNDGEALILFPWL